MTKDEALKLALEALRLQIDVSDWEEQEKANTASFEAITAIREALAEQPAQQQEPSTLFESFQEFGEGWERLAWELCADENGEEACSELIWEGGPIPEPWGDRWLKYEDEAKRLIALVQKHTSPQPAQQQEPVAWLIWLHGPAGHFDHKQFAELEFERRNKEYPDPDRKLLPLYTSPPASKPWVGLTDEKIKKIWGSYFSRGIEFARAIEAKLKEKNA